MHSMLSTELDSVVTSKNIYTLGKRHTKLAILVISHYKIPKRKLNLVGYYCTSALSWQLWNANNFSVCIAIEIKFGPTYRSAWSGKSHAALSANKVNAVMAAS